MNSPGPSTDLDHELSLDLYAVMARVNGGASEDHLHAIADSDLSLNKLKLLHILARPHTRPPRITRVGALLGVDPSAATRLVNELDQERYVDRVDDESDQRVRRVVITPKGRELLYQLASSSIRGIEAFVGSLTAPEERELRRGLRPLLARPDVAALRPAD